MTLSNQPNYLVTNPKLTVRFGMENSNIIEMLVGEGSQRAEYSMTDTSLLLWILAFREPTERHQVVALAVNDLQLTEDNALELIEEMLSLQILCVCGEQGLDIPQSELMWEKRGWRDALDFHRATRDMLWRHDYSGNPKVMTWYQYDRRVMPKEPEPIGKKIEDKWPKISLPSITNNLGNVSYGKAIQQRRTTRHFVRAPMSLQIFSDLLGYAFGYSGYKEGKGYTATPSYSLGKHVLIYPVIVNVDGLSPGVYLYNPEGHNLHQIRSGNFEEELIEYAQNGDFMKNISVGVFYTVHWSQYMWKYRYPRAYRFALMELAGVVQTGLICASGLGIKTFLTPAIADTKVAELLEISNDLTECPLYVTGFGYSRIH